MAKIRTVNTSVGYNSKKVSVSFDVFYSSTHGFYGKIPEKYWPTVSMYDEKALKEKSIKFERTSKYQSDAPLKSVMVMGSSEEEAVKNTSNVIAEVIRSTKKIRPVILVFFNRDTSTHNREHGEKSNIKHSPLKIGMSLKYTSEVVIDGGEAKYYDFYTRKYFEKEEEDQDQIHIYGRENFVVLDDTPENRMMLETAYEKLNELSLKLNEVLTSKDNIIRIVESGQLLLK